MKEVSFNVDVLLAWCKRVRKHAGEGVVRVCTAGGQPSMSVFDREHWCEARTPFADVPQSGDPDAVWFVPIALLIDALAAASATTDAAGTVSVDDDADVVRFTGGGVVAAMPLAGEQLWWSPPKTCDISTGVTLGQLAAVKGFARDVNINTELAVVRVERDAVVATDLARVGWIDCETALGAEDYVSVPSHAVGSADMFLPGDAAVMVGVGAWCAEWMGDRFTSSTVVAPFPAWRTVVARMVPEGGPSAGGRRPFMLSRSGVARALKDLSSKSFDPVVAVHFSFKDGDQLVVSRRAIEGGFVSIDVPLLDRFDGDDLTLTFQCSALAGSLRAWKSDAVVMWAGSPTDPTMWWSDDDLKFIQTPVQEKK